MKKLIPALLLLCALPVQAKTTLYSWSGIVTNADWKLSVGDTINGTLQIDDTIPTFDDVGDSHIYNGAAFLSFNAGGETFSRAGTWDWRVSSTGQGLGNVPMVSQTTAGDVDWAVNEQNPDLSLAEADNLEGNTGSWGADVWDNITHKESNFWGNILTIQKNQPLADAAPTPEPSSFVLMGSALIALVFLRKELGGGRRPRNEGQGQRAA